MRAMTATVFLTASCLLGAGAPSFAQDIALATNASGVTIGGSKPAWSTGFGSVNGLGLGAPGTGQTVLPSSGGVLYAAPYNIVVTGASSGSHAIVRAYVSTTFSHTSILRVYSCVSSCTSAASFTAMSTDSGSPTDVIGSPGLSSNQTVTRYLAVFVSDQNGAAAFSGADSATVTFLVYRNNNSLQQTYTLTLDNPSENVQTAVSLTLGSAGGGRTVASGADFTLAYSNVNGLGINPATGLTTTSVTGGQIYATPYVLQPQFSSFSSTTGTLKAYVSVDFAHPAQLELRDSGSGSGFSTLSKTSGAQTTLTASAASGTSLTRYLGLFVANTNGAGIFTGSDNATVTFTLVVP